MWRRSSFCNGASACVEVAELPDGGVVLRDGKDPHGPRLVFTPLEWAAFVAGVLAGEFDLSTFTAQLAEAGDETGGDAAVRVPDAPEARVEPSQVSR